VAVPKPPVPWGKAARLDVESIIPNPWNPNAMSEEDLAKERESFNRFGFVNPIIVRLLDGDLYQIIDGEQRWTVAKQLGMTEIDAYDISPIGDFEAQQLTFILNELRGKPREDKLAELLKGLLAQDTMDRLVAVLPLTKEQFGKAAKLPEFDWANFKNKVGEQGSRQWKERIFRLSPEAAETLDAALRKAKDAAEGEMQDWQALEVIAAAFLGQE